MLQPYIVSTIVLSDYYYYEKIARISGFLSGGRNGLQARTQGGFEGLGRTPLFRAKVKGKGSLPNIARVRKGWSF